MRALLITTMPYVLWAMTLFDALFIFSMFREFKKGKSAIAILTAILCLGLFYDSLILALGSVLDYGALLKTLSQFRYILHLVLIPLLFPICAYALTENKTVIRIVWIVTLVIMAMGLYASISVVTEPRTVGAIRRYATSDLTPAFADRMTSLLDVVPVFFMIGIGIYLLIKKKNEHMLLAGAMMLLFTLLGIFLGKDPGGDKTQSLMFYISMYGEALMIYHLWRFVRKENAKKQ